MTTIPMGPYKVALRCRTNQLQLLVTEMGDDVLKACLSPGPEHPRALLTLLEGLALWQGAPLCAAVSVDEDARACFEQVFYGDGGLLGPSSPMVSIEFRADNVRPRRLRGLGDFRQLRLLGGAW
jgi:hypothetical protein